MNILLDKICAKMKQLDGSQGCVVGKGNTIWKERDWYVWGIADYVCSKCIITRALNIAKELWPCPLKKLEKCFNGFVIEIDKTVTPQHWNKEVCPECHGLGIAREAFWEECHICKKGGFGYQRPHFECTYCKGTGQIKCEPWAVVRKLLKEPKDIENDDYWQGYLKADRVKLKAKFFQLFWLWEQLRLTFEGGDGKEK